MAVTLTQASYLESDVLKKGIIDTIIYESPFIARLPFIEINGNAYAYNLETTAGGANWYDVGDTITEKTPVWAKRTVDLSELINDADVDSFIQQTRTNEQDVKVAVIEKASKAIANEFEKQAIWGQQSDEYSTKQMKGLIHLICEVESATQTAWDTSENTQICYPATAAALALVDLDELIDLIKPGKPDALIMNRRLRRKLKSLMMASGSTLRVAQDQFGKQISYYDQIPILICDWITDNIDDSETTAGVTRGDQVTRSIDYDATRTTALDSSLIFAVKFGEDGLCGIQNKGIQVEDLGTLETKDATRTRIKWYCGMANFSKYSIAVLEDVTHTAAG